MKTTITEGEKLQLLGLLTLGRSHNKIVNQVNDEMARIVGDEDKYSALTDAVYDEADIDEVLKNMEITVEE